MHGIILNTSDHPITGQILPSVFSLHHIEEKHHLAEPGPKFLTHKAIRYESMAAVLSPKVYFHGIY